MEMECNLFHSILNKKQKFKQTHIFVTIQQQIFIFKYATIL